jgi:hypothetical protein
MSEERDRPEETPWKDESAEGAPEAEHSIGPAEAQLDYGQPEPETAEAEEAPDADEAGEAPADRPAVPRLGPLPITVWVAFLIGVVIALSGLWIGSELHYQSCLTAANDKAAGATDPLTRLVRIREINACSRSPF